MPQEQFYHGRMQIFFEDVKTALKNFNKKNYSAQYEELKLKYEKTFWALEEEYLRQDAQEVWLKKVSEELIQAAKMLIQSKKWKYQQRNQQFDCNMFTVAYLLPMVGGFEGSMSEPLAKMLAQCWNQTFGTQLQPGSYEQLQEGFGNTILGIKIGK